ncbi:MAG TPA: helix-turn-helix domain-containing protein [Tenericutes bacterium]|nr:helix-turn-helix domain-containing protein [Mycoplasmatota bacterium]
MKEIGEKLRIARENMGISVEEAAEDLKLRPSQIENIENGKMEAFKDITYLKYFIRDYSKYLGLDKDDMVDEFNEYLFDYTSKISIDDIKSAKRLLENKKEDKKRIRSPYTLEKRRFYLSPVFIYSLIFVLIIVIIFCVITIINSNNDDFISNSINSGYIIK